MTFEGTCNKIATFPPNDNVSAFSELPNIKFKQQNPSLHQVCSASLQATQLWRGLLGGSKETPLAPFAPYPRTTCLNQLVLGTVRGSGPQGTS